MLFLWMLSNSRIKCLRMGSSFNQFQPYMILKRNRQEPNGTKKRFLVKSESKLADFWVITVLLTVVFSNIDLPIMY